MTGRGRQGGPGRRAAQTRPFACALLVAAAIVFGGAGAGADGGAAPDEASRLARLVRAAAALDAPPPRFVERRAIGVDGVALRALAVAPSDPRRLYAAADDGRLYRSDDGGAIWTARRIVARRPIFWGGLRKAPTHETAPFTMDAFVADAREQGFLSFGLDSLFLFPYGTTGECYLELCPDSPAFWGGATLPGAPGAFAPGPGPGPLVRGRSYKPMGRDRRLVAFLFSRDLDILDLNLPLYFHRKGEAPTALHHVAIHPTDPDHVLVASDVGLWRSRDGGARWERIFRGVGAESKALVAAFDPTTPGTIHLGTEGGLRVSRDGGATFFRAPHPWLQLMQTNRIAWSPAAPRTLYAATFRGLFRSDDGGASWRHVFFRHHLDQAFVTRLAVHPETPERVVLSTRDGLFRTTDGGASWTRLATFLFAQEETHVAGHPRDGDRLACVTPRAVWESGDGGATWRVVHENLDGTLRDPSWDPRAADALWVMAVSGALRITASPPAAPDPAGLATLRERLRAEPSLAETIAAAARWLGVDPGRATALRRRARWRHALPEVHVAGGVMRVDAGAALLVPTQWDTPWRGSVYGVDHLDDAATRTETAMDRDHGLTTPFVFAGLSWDFAPLVFDRDELPDGPLFHQADDVYRRLLAELRAAHEERTRVMARLLTQPTLDATTRVRLALRLEELTARFAALTDGLWRAPLTWAVALRRETTR